MIPKSLQGILWSKKISNISLTRDKNYIIHQVLMYGSFEDINWLFKTYPAGVIKEEFVKNPAKIYTKPAFNFVRRFILGLGKRKLKEEDYVKTLFQSS